MEQNVILAIVIFAATYLIIISERIHRSAIAMLGAFLMLIFNVESQEKAFEHIDFNTIGLLIGMMIIVNIMKRSGFFEYLAIKAAKLAKGDPWKIIVSFCFITAISSALLDNVTTILLIAPVTFVVTDKLELNPIPFLLPEILISNIGGTATLIGDPPNIMIGSAANLGFMDFVTNLAPVIVIVFIVIMFILKFIYKKDLKCKTENKMKIMKLDEKLAIKDKKILIKSSTVLILTIIGFMLHQKFGYESATIALIGASVLLVIGKVDVEELFYEIEWPTIFFFASLFMLVGALEEVGIMETLATKMINLTNGNIFLTAMIILWGSAIASAFLDNIPFVATMIPLIRNMSEVGGLEVGPLWWSLALGACLGGNGSLVGASANVIVAGMLEKKNNKLGFITFLKIGFPIMIVSVFISCIYLIIFYF
ncbi:ArsB/NhaD family transporter [Helicovermis profundi]|uniref:ArsB/NhaD family transporter n=1 Tax=Helicovermis profundi TaxID=3065157 RepID=A0AAU9EN38_9FIRM|nr:ArsB/NhaD family transporter [Clostridia bacterium S502]